MEIVQEMRALDGDREQDYSGEKHLTKKPLCIDLYCELGGWSEGFLAEDYDCIGFDIKRHNYGSGGYPGQLVLQDVLTLHGSQLKDASAIVASPPCQEFSYMSLPFSRGKKIAAALRGHGEFPDDYSGSKTIAELTRLFDNCFRIQQEACVAAGKHIPLVVENVRGSQPWVGNAAQKYGNFYLFGDVPALMPRTSARKIAGYSDPRRNGGKGAHLTSQRENDIRRQGVKNGKDWFGSGENCSLQRRSSSGSESRKAASANIAKIPLELSQWIAQVFKP